MFAMFDGLSFPVLLADGQAIRNVVRGLQHRQQEFDSSGLTTALLIFCLFFVAVWGVARIFVRSDGKSAQNNARALLGELCRAHRLTRRDAWFLARLARYHRLTEPALLFLDPLWLDPAQCGPAWRQHTARLRDLQRELFAGLASTLPSDGAGTTRD